MLHSLVFSADSLRLRLVLLQGFAQIRLQFPQVAHIKQALQYILIVNVAQLRADLVAFAEAAQHPIKLLVLNRAHLLVETLLL